MHHPQVPPGGSGGIKSTQSTVMDSAGSWRNTLRRASTKCGVIQEPMGYSTEYYSAIKRNKIGSFVENGPRDCHTVRKRKTNTIN